MYPDISCVRSRSLLRTKRRGCPFPVGSKTVVLGGACVSPCQTSLPFCVRMRLLVLSEKVSCGPAQPMWVGMVLPVQAFFRTHIQHCPSLAVSVGEEGLSSTDGQQGGWRSSSLERRPAPVWLETSELDPSVQVSLGSGHLLKIQKKDLRGLTLFWLL